MNKRIQMNMQEKLSSLWIVIMFSMVFADILSFMYPGTLKQIVDESLDVKITQELLLLFSVLLAIPISMIYLSRVLKYTINRLANIIASVITILFVIAGGSLYLHYIFFASIETLCLFLIIWNAWKWPKQNE